MTYFTAAEERAENYNFKARVQQQAVDGLRDDFLFYKMTLQTSVGRAWCW